MKIVGYRLPIKFSVKHSVIYDEIMSVILMYKSFSISNKLE